MQTKWSRWLLSASLGVGCWLSLGETGQAQHWGKSSHGGSPPVYVVPGPGCPQPLPLMPPAPKHPSDLPPGREEPRPDQQMPQLDQPAPDMGAPDVGGPSLETGTTNTMIGRGDQLNRFNLFDNMAAVPQTRVWFGLMYLEGFDVGRPTGPGSDSLSSNVASQLNRRNEVLYRTGAELALGERFSFAVQGQYISGFDTSSANDSWAAPQLMGKFALIRNEATTVSAIFGLQPQISVTEGEPRDRATLFYPGMLFYRNVSDNLFVQGGFQVGVPSNNNFTTTLDYALSFGYWLYRNDEVSDCGRRPLLTGIIPQVEFFGRNTLAGSTVVDDLDMDNVSAQSARNVFDVTVGGRLQFRRLYWANGFSVPITGPDIRRTEYSTSVGFNF